MRVAVAVRTRRAFPLACPADEAATFLADVAASARLFPLVEAIGRAPAFDEGGATAWRTALRPQGPPPFAIRPEYVSRYRYDAEARTLEWSPVPDAGNAFVSGRCQVRAEGRGCEVTLEIAMTTEVPAPRFARRAVQAAVQLGFDAAVAAYANRLRSHFDR